MITPLRLAEGKFLPAGNPPHRDQTEASAQMRLAMVRAAVRSLPPRQRAVLVLHFYLGLQLAEVAGILDVPIGTAKSRLHRGLEALRDSMRGTPEQTDRLAAERLA